MTPVYNHTTWRATMSWRLKTEDEKVDKPLSYTDEFTSKEEALNTAYEYCTLVLYRRVLHIEGPNGERIEQPEIAEWCSKELDRRMTANRTRR
jgi:hypothetical protein